MIYETYINPNKPKSKLFPALSPVPMTTAGEIMKNGFGRAYNEYWAGKKGCTLDEFIERDMQYHEQAKKADYFINAVMYPFSWEEFQKKGTCRILKIDRNYAHSDLEWDEEKPIYLVEAISQKNSFQIFRATPKFFRKEPPVDPALTPAEPKEGD